MTSRDRFLAMLSGEPVDRPFLWESGMWGTAVQRWRTEGLPPEADPYEYLGLERIGCVTLSYEPDPPFSEHILEQNEEWVLVETEAGELFRRYLKPACLRDVGGIETAYIRFALRDRPSWQLMQERLDPASRARREAFAGFLTGKKEKPAPNSGLSGSFNQRDGIAAAIYVMMPTYWFVRKAGLLTASTLYYDDPALVQEIFSTFTDEII